MRILGRGLWPPAFSHFWWGKGSLGSTGIGGLPIDYHDDSDTKAALEASYLQCSDSKQDEVRRRASENFKAFLSRIQGEPKAMSESSGSQEAGLCLSTHPEGTET